MKEVQAYRCEHCGKIYLMKTACLKHEVLRCTRNPQNRPICYNCNYYQPSMEDDKRETIEYQVENPWSSQDIFITKKFDPNKCRKKGCKLFNNIKLSDEMQEALHEAGFYPMPLPKDGCSDFEVADGYKNKKLED